jgi:hypothetical protein
MESGYIDLNVILTRALTPENFRRQIMLNDAIDEEMGRAYRQKNWPMYWRWCHRGHDTDFRKTLRRSERIWRKRRNAPKN